MENDQDAVTNRVDLQMRPLALADCEALPVARDRLESYLADQAVARRWVRVAQLGGRVAGYVTLLWAADDPVLRRQGIPEISDLRVLREYRRRGVGAALLDEAETRAATRSRVVGLNVGLHSGYGTAQRLYARRGYVPDGSGAVIEGVTVPEGATIRLDDDPIVTLRMTKLLALDLPADPPRPSLG